MKVYTYQVFANPRIVKTIKLYKLEIIMQDVLDNKVLIHTFFCSGINSVLTLLTSRRKTQTQR